MARQSQGKMAGWVRDPRELICAKEGGGRGEEICGSNALFALSSPFPFPF